MKATFEINMNHASFSADWRLGLASVLSSFCGRLATAHYDVPQDIKLIDVNGVTVGTVKITEEDDAK